MGCRWLKSSQPIPNHKSQWGALSGVPGNRRKHCKRSLGRAQGVRRWSGSFFKNRA